MTINKTMISIDGLNKNQVALLNKIWTCKGENEFLEWFSGLSMADQKTTESLLKLLSYEVLEHEFMLDNFDEANAVLSKFRLGH